MLHNPRHESAQRAAKELLQLLSWNDIKLSTAVLWLVRNVIPLSGLIVVYGPPKCGKTFWVFDLVMHIALGWAYRKKRTRQAPVVYCLFEGQTAFAARAEAWRQSYLAEHAENVQFFLMPIKIQLVADHQRLIESIRLQTGGVKPGLIVMDTLNRSITGSESSDVDMTAYVAACDAVRDAFAPSAVIVVHHSGLEGGRARGHTSLLGAADTQIGVKQDDAKNIIATVEYMKDGPADEQLVSRLKVVEVGIDDEGEPITSCIVEPSDDLPRAKPQKAVSLTPAATIALKALRTAVIEHGIVPPASNHIPSHVKVITENLWRRYAYQMGISTSDEERAKQVAFKRGAERLIAANLVAQWGGGAMLALCIASDEANMANTPYRGCSCSFAEQREHCSPIFALFAFP